ncbi:MAG: UDP-N-acetylmuramoyl-L-alanyl-D-glutamate--2,6-diaminopimelate ligase [Desulfobacteraceae bacterium]
MRFSQLLKGLEVLERMGAGADPEVKGLAYDSRKAAPGCVFVALRGLSHDGHQFINEALQRGAAAVVAEELKDLDHETPAVRVNDSRKALALLSSRFYGSPQEELELIGITGTNGKTSTTYILESILEAAGRSPGVIGSINHRFGGETRPALVTTPESLDLMELLREMADHGVTDVAMEVSSHALNQGRIRECSFQVVVFTSFSRDHLDYHQDMEDYFQAKSLLFKGPGEGGFSGRGPAVINLDDPKGTALAGLCSRPVLTYGLDESRDIRAEDLREGPGGLKAVLRTPEGSCRIESSLIGRVNIYNILAAAGAALSLGIGLDAVEEGIRRLRGVPGRLEKVDNPLGLNLVVDYAHTPDALAKVLEALRPLVPGRLITVLGCGGDRDRGKRPEMGLLAGRLSDLVVVTSDNPRTEDPFQIIAQVQEGVRAAGLSRLDSIFAKGEGYLVEPDRREAIRKAVFAASTEDLVLAAGKGHEDYQILGTRRIHFDDREELSRAAGERAAGESKE